MPTNQTNKPVAIVTGANGVIGKAIATGIAKGGCAVTMVCRDEKRAAQALDEVRRSSSSSNVRVELADLSRRESVFALAARWQGRLDVLVNNAALAPRRRTETPEGIEVQFATNVLGYVWMMRAFEPALRQSAPARVVNVASYWAGDLDLADLQFQRRRYDNDQAYRQSKQANRMLTVAFAQRWRGLRITGRDLRQILTHSFVEKCKSTRYSWSSTSLRGTKMQIGNETVVTIHYTLTDAKGVVLDSSAGEEPLSFVHGAGTMIPGLEKALLGKSPGESMKISVAPADGYGLRDEDLVQKVPRKNFPVEDVEVGMHFQTRSPNGPRVVTVLAADDENITVDANHPLAGATLNFDVQVLSVRAATPEDLTPSCGSCETCSGHHH
jgi:FKBP-type peptidyl-prolyl cis-trans isomerase 2/NAD(P)-dependent dehydrogenase (short-subunit alcohol dehydrogenase family)